MIVTVPTPILPPAAVFFQLSEIVSELLAILADFRSVASDFSSACAIAQILA
jgi:hypothetical protein